jgi:dipeptidyl aminopeptidase/acylaminoacyl peptidase
LFSHTTAISAYSCHPDGQRIAFIAREAEPKASTKLKDQGFNQEIYEEDRRSVKVWIAALDTDDKPAALELEGSASLIRWSPAGDRLAVVLAPTALVDDSYMRRQVCVVDPETGEILARLDHAAKLEGLAWSPDGRRLVTISGENLNDPSAGRLLLWTASGTLVGDLLPDETVQVQDVAWPQDTTLIYAAADGVGSRVGAINPSSDTRRVFLETTTAAIETISSSSSGTTLSCVASTPRHPAEAFRLQPSAPTLKRLTLSNPWLGEKRLAPQEIVHWKARDGLDLEGLLIRPLDEKPGQRYPLMMIVHGGPESHVPNGWLTSYSRLGQVAAARGLAAFYPNYRGSTGRGVPFSKMGQADAAGAEFDDLIDGIDALIETGLVDRDRVGITGGSYGGYASAWGATFYSDRFAASVMFVGLANLISKSGTTDIPFEMYAVHHRKWLWEDWDYFLERSPIYHVQRSKTPLLILHGREDTRVHPSQSMELYRHLKVLDQAPVRLVFYPGEGHGNRRAASRLDYSLRLMRWMQHYLQGPGGDAPPYALDYRLPEAGDESDEEAE